MSKLYRITTSAFYLSEHTKTISLCIAEYPIIATTQKGVWIKDWSARRGRRWVSSTATKRFAYPTVEEARISYIKRTKKYIIHLRRRLEEAEIGLSFATQDPIKLMSIASGLLQ